MWEKIKTKLNLLWIQIKPELYQFVKAVIRAGIDILLPIAIDAVSQAVLQKNLSGKEKFEFAVDVVKKKVPDVAIDKALNAVRIAYTAKSGNPSVY